tara:strand:- start:177312 stop:177908 length:597 start_codon:yes stop_codon:yes gene_type:complete
MIDEPFRAKLPKFVDPLLRLYKALGLTPNSVTLLGLGFGIIAAFLVAREMFVPAIAVWWLGRLLDGTDGIYARKTNQSSHFGAQLDILSDMAAYSAMIIGFNFAFPELQSLWSIILLLYVLCITGALSLGNLQDKMNIPTQNNRGLRLASGIAEGGETGIAYTLFLIFPEYIIFLARVWILILIVTVIARLILAKREL